MRAPSSVSLAVPAPLVGAPAGVLSRYVELPCELSSCLSFGGWYSDCGPVCVCVCVCVWVGACVCVFMSVQISDGAH